MNRILPPGSTSVELQAEVNTAGSGDTIIISGDMPFTGTVTIPAGKEITIQSDTGNNWVMSSPGTTNTRHFMVRGGLVLQDIILDGENIAGGVNPQNGSFTMNSGSVIQNCFVNTGGGGVYAFFSTFTMNSGSVIQNCSVSFPTNDVDGGGVCLVNSTFAMNSGSAIRDCFANGSGGGVSAGGTGIYKMTDCTISGNRAGRHGGGVATMNDVALNMDGVTISGNAAAQRGGGVYVLSRSSLNITGESHFANNSAQDGGGIYTADTNYANLSTGAGTEFIGNTASVDYAPPADAKIRYPAIQFTSTSTKDHPLNNYDINYIGAEPITYRVNYVANGGTGAYASTSIPFATIYIVLTSAATGISRDGYTLSSWNTQPDGHGVAYSPGDMITITENVTLYAQWVAAERFIITYGANGGSGSFEDSGRHFGDNYTILSSSQVRISRPGFTFTGWNTNPDGSGISFAPGDIITITGDMMLYALWRQNPAPRPASVCQKSVMKCRTTIVGQKIWDDNNNTGNTRPDNIELLLLRDGEIYRREIVDSTSAWAFTFFCVPLWKNSGHKYDYQIDEANVPSGYTKTIEGYRVINTLTP